MSADRRDRWGPQDLRDRKVLRVRRVPRARPVQRGLSVLPGQLVRRVPPARPGLRDRRVRRVGLGLREHLGLRACPDLLVRMARLDCRVGRVRRDHKDRRVNLVV